MNARPIAALLLAAVVGCAADPPEPAPTPAPPPPEPSPPPAALLEATPLPPAPRALKAVLIAPRRATTSEAVTFDASRSVLPERGTAAYHWDFGDGHNSPNANPVHMYGAAGTYPVTLTIITVARGRSPHWSRGPTSRVRVVLPEDLCAAEM